MATIGITFPEKTEPEVKPQALEQEKPAKAKKAPAKPKKTRK